MIVARLFGCSCLHLINESYVYNKLLKLTMNIITNKASNITEVCNSKMITIHSGLLLGNRLT